MIRWCLYWLFLCCLTDFIFWNCRKSAWSSLSLSNFCDASIRVSHLLTLTSSAVSFAFRSCLLLPQIHSTSFDLFFSLIDNFLSWSIPSIYLPSLTRFFFFYFLPQQFPLTSLSLFILFFHFQLDNSYFTDYTLNNFQCILIVFIPNLFAFF